MQLDVGGSEAGPGVCAVGAQRCEWLNPRSRRVVRLAQHRPEEVVQARDQFPMGAVGGSQGHDRAPSPGDGLPLGAKHGHVGAAEAVDGLLGVADDEQLAAVAIQAAHQPALPVVGVLKLVHQQRGRLSLPACPYRRIRLQQRQRAGFQVVEVQSVALALACGVAVVGELKAGPQAGHARRPASRPAG